MSWLRQCHVMVASMSWLRYDMVTSMSCHGYANVMLWLRQCHSYVMTWLRQCHVMVTPMSCYGCVNVKSWLRQCHVMVTPKSCYGCVNVMSWLRQCHVMVASMSWLRYDMVTSMSCKRCGTYEGGWHLVSLNLQPLGPIISEGFSRLQVLGMVSSNFRVGLGPQLSYV